MKGHYSVGIIGLGVMGRNLAQNLLNSKTQTAVYSYVDSETVPFKNHQDAKICTSLKDLVKSLETPRKVLLMVTSGEPVDRVIQDLLPLLDEADIIIDGGNSFFEDTQRRQKELNKNSIEFLGTGISGGAEGALHGASIMVGGSQNAYLECESIFNAISTTASGEPCFAHIGPDGAGHLVKMVHNGIEYGLMQLIAECYGFMKQGLQWPVEKIQSVFVTLNQGANQSYLMEITAKVLSAKDPASEGFLLDVISDKAAQKGTGRWTVTTAMNLGVPIPTIIAAVTERTISALTDDRQAIAAASTQATEAFTTEKSSTSEQISTAALTETVMTDQDWINAMEHALLSATILTYAQGFSLINAASDEYHWSVKLDSVAAIWRNGCIIRSALLEDIKLAFGSDAQHHLLVAMAKPINQGQSSLRTLIKSSIHAGISMPAFTSALSYFDSYSATQLPTNLIQAQRDFFGAHSFERTDKAGQHHGDWNKS